MRRWVAIIALALPLAIPCSPAVASSAGPHGSAQLRRARALVGDLAPRRGAARTQAARPRPMFALRADGYSVSVSGSGERVSVEVAKEEGHGIGLSSYLVRGAVTRGALRASFGKLGAVDMRFRPAAGHDWAQPNRDCRGRHRFQVRDGVFVGRFRFRGEGGYVTAVARRVKGSVREVAPRCLHGRARARLARGAVPHTGNTKHSPERAYLYAAWQRGVSSAALFALKTKRGTTELFADTETSRGGMAIVRVASAIGGRRALRANDVLTSSRLTGPAPFAGTGRFAAAPDGTRTWRGGLTVDFPGLAGFPLTGPEYEVQVGRTADPLFVLLLLLS